MSIPGGLSPKKNSPSSSPSTLSPKSHRHLSPNSAHLSAGVLYRHHASARNDSSGTGTGSTLTPSDSSDNFSENGGILRSAKLLYDFAGVNSAGLATTLAVRDVVRVIRKEQGWYLCEASNSIEIWIPSNYLEASEDEFVSSSSSLKDLSPPIAIQKPLSPREDDGAAKSSPDQDKKISRTPSRTFSSGVMKEKINTNFFNRQSQKIGALFSSERKGTADSGGGASTVGSSASIVDKEKIPLGKRPKRHDSQSALGPDHVSRRDNSTSVVERTVTNTSPHESKRKAKQITRRKSESELLKSLEKDRKR